MSFGEENLPGSRKACANGNRVTAEMSGGKKKFAATQREEGRKERERGGRTDAADGGAFKRRGSTLRYNEKAEKIPLLPSLARLMRRRRRLLRVIALGRRRTEGRTPLGGHP